MPIATRLSATTDGSSSSTPTLMNRNEPPQIAESRRSCRVSRRVMSPILRVRVARCVGQLIRVDPDGAIGVSTEAASAVAWEHWLRGSIDGVTAIPQAPAGSRVSRGARAAGVAHPRRRSGVRATVLEAGGSDDTGRPRAARRDRAERAAGTAAGVHVGIARRSVPQRPDRDPARRDVAVGTARTRGRGDRHRR